MDRLRVVTLNIWNRGGPWERRLELIREELTRLKPDLVGLQEVLEMEVDGKRESQALAIAEGLGFEVAYGKGHELDFGGPTGVLFGNAVLSNYPLEETEVIPLPGQDRSDQARSLLCARVAAPFGPVHFFVTHLNWPLNEGSIRLEQVGALVEAIDRRAPNEKGHFPPILVGDLNAEPESDEIRFLNGLATVDGRSTYFADAWRYAGEGPGFTFDPRNDYAATCNEPPRRIDYIFVGSPGLVGLGKPISARLAFDQPVEGVFPSDHFGIVADLRTGEP